MSIPQLTPQFSQSDSQNFPKTPSRFTHFFKSYIEALNEDYEKLYQPEKFCMKKWQHVKSSDTYSKFMSDCKKDCYSYRQYVNWSYKNL